MILDSKDNAQLYKGISNNLDTAIDYIVATDFSSMSDGTVKIDGDDVYAMIQRYETEGTENREYEAHRSYVDLQFLVDGFETMICRNVNGLDETVPYDEEKDVALYRLSATSEGTELRMRAGDFAVLFPQDAHVPKIMSGAPGKVLKVVVKVRV